MTQSLISDGVKAGKLRRGLLIGAGYFSKMHLDAWQRMANTEIVCVCDLDISKARAVADEFGVRSATTDLSEALHRDDLDFVDIVTGPTGRLEIVRHVVERGLPTICQKPLANDFQEARQIIDLVTSRGQTFMVHENFDFSRGIAK